MRKKVLFLFGIPLIFLVLLIVIRFIIQQRMPQLGVLKVTSNVTARVLLNNKDIGKTPLEQKVAAGEYTLRLVPDSVTKSLASWQGRVVVYTNTLSFVSRDLAETELTSSGEQLWVEKLQGKHAELSVISVPEGSTVIVDEQIRGLSPVSLTDLSFGDHTVVVNSPGFEPRTVRVKLTSGYRSIVAASLALSPQQIAAPLLLQSSEATTAGISTEVLPTPLASTVTPKPTISSTIAPTQPLKKVKILDTPTGFLRVREKPTVDSAEIGRVQPGEVYRVVQTQGTWVLIEYKNLQGWVSVQYVEGV